MAVNPVYETRVRIHSLELLGTCDVCRALVSARRPWARAHELEIARCPRCGGRLTLDPATVFAEFDVTPKPEARA